MSLQYLKKEVKNEVDFLHVDKHQSFLKHFGHQSFLHGWYYSYINGHGQAFSNYSITILQYLYNISKRKLEMEVILACR